MTNGSDEIEEKTERLVRLAMQAGVKGILLTLQPNFAWLTGGRSNRVDGSREPGAGSLLVTADRRRFIVANAIETPRLASEALASLGFESIAFPWEDERADPTLPFRAAANAAGGRIGTDGSSPEAVPLDPMISRLRAPLVEAEVARYRELGRDLGHAIGQAARSIAHGITEQEAAGHAASALIAAGLRPIVLLVAADDRIARYRHPVPTQTRWQDRLLLATCAERSGLIACASRIVSAGPPAADLVARTEATARVFAALVDATRPGVTGAELYSAAAAVYAANGFPGEERLHHQGGATGYRSREWVAHPRSTDVVTPAQAFAWNPTITGSKVEETVLVHGDGRIEVITRSPDWPSIDIRIRDTTMALPGVLQRS